MKILLALIFIGFCFSVPFIVTERLAASTFDALADGSQDQNSSPPSDAGAGAANSDKFLTTVIASVKNLFAEESKASVEEVARARNSGIVRF